MDGCKGPNESHIYWNRNKKNPSNQQIYRFNGLLMQLESLEEKMVHLNHNQLKEIRGVSDVVRNTNQGLVAEIDSAREHLLLQVGDIANSLCNFKQVEDQRYKKEKKYLESIIKKVKKSDKKQSSYENQAMDAFSQLLKSVNEVLLNQGETDEQLEQIKNDISIYGNMEEIHHSKELMFLETLINIVTQIDENQKSYGNKSIEALSQLLTSVNEVQSSQGEADEQLEQIKNEISNYGSIEEMNHRKEQEYFETILKHVNQLELNQMSQENQAREALFKLMSEIKKVNDNQGSADEQLVQLKNQLSSHRNIDDYHHSKEEEYLESISNQINKLNENHTSFENQASIAYSELLSKFEEANTLQEATDYQLKRISDNFSEYQNLEAIRYEKEQIDLENIYNTLNKLGEKHTSFETKTISSNAHISNQLEEIHTLQGEVVKLFEKINSTIIKLLATLPTGKKISSVTVKGSQLDLHSFIKFDEETNMATFQRSDGSLVMVDSRQILAITFPSSI
jgi:hypothetical protein